MRKIALVGTASSGGAAPYNDPSWEIWGVSARAPYVTRANRWFELHRLDGEPPEWAASWRAEMRRFTVDIPDVLMFWPEPVAPKVSLYPKERIVERFGSYFMTSSFAWMMALAIDEMVPRGQVAKPGQAEIGIWGVDMEYGTEYRQQRVGFRHFIDLADSLGVTVTRLVSGGLVWEPTPYPFWQDDALVNKLDLRNRHTKTQIEKFDKSLASTRTLIAQDVAVLEEIQRMKQADYDPDARLASVQKELDGLMQTSANLSKDIVHWTAVDETERWFQDYLQP